MSGDLIAVEVLHAIAAAMRELGVRWYVFGAQAAIIWGSPRLSSDVDVTMEPLPATTIADAFLRNGFDVIAAGREFVERTRVIALKHRETKMPVDVVLAGPGLEDEFMARAIDKKVAGRTMPVMSPEDLIATKILAGRAKDLEDVRAVMRTQCAELDVERVRALLRLLEEVLTRGDLVSEFETEWARAISTSPPC